MSEKKKRQPGNFDFYKEKGDDQWECKTCGATIMAILVRHPVWDGPFPCSGLGRVETVPAPYCPNCEEEPSSRGAPIRV